MPPALRVASLSDVGRVRSANEDSSAVFVRPDGAQLCVVADGMGGHRGGATASREAVQTIGAVFEAGASDPSTGEPDQLLLRAIESANAHVHALSRADPELAGMGTTVVAVIVEAGGRAAIAHVGDSRGYRYRAGQLEALTTDHSVVAEMVRRGVLSADEAAIHPRRNEILRSVGVLRDVEIEVAPVALADGDWILLCSDGLCGVVSDAEIELVLAESASIEQAAEALVALANECGGPDNVTVVVGSLAGDPAGMAMLDATRDGAVASRRAAAMSGAPTGARAGSGDPETPPGTADAGRDLRPGLVVLAILVGLALVGAWLLGRLR